jgi:1,4-alpha-glucan branching enzyme
MSLIWSDDGYPASGVYRDYHHHTIHHHKPWNNEGGAYENEAAQALAREHAADFVARTLTRLRTANESAPPSRPLPGGGLVVCALDTELLGHWWYEGITWLRAVVQECERQGLELVRLDDALERHDWPAVELENWASGSVSTWGKDGDLSTWSAPAVAEMAFTVRGAELEVLAAGERAGTAAVRELLALQASDWPFMISREIAVPYARERFEGHRQALEGALAAGEHAEIAGARNLAVDADRAYLLDPS